MLLIVVILCIVDCVLVLGEFILDFYKVKGKFMCICSIDINIIFFYFEKMLKEYIKIIIILKII